MSVRTRLLPAAAEGVPATEGGLAEVLPATLAPATLLAASELEGASSSGSKPKWSDLRVWAGGGGRGGGGRGRELYSFVSSQTQAAGRANNTSPWPPGGWLCPCFWGLGSLGRS